MIVLAPLERDQTATASPEPSRATSGASALWPGGTVEPVRARPTRQLPVSQGAQRARRGTREFQPDTRKSADSIPHSPPLLSRSFLYGAGAGDGGGQSAAVGKRHRRPGELEGCFSKAPRGGAVRREITWRHTTIGEAPVQPEADALDVPPAIHREWQRAGEDSSVFPAGMADLEDDDARAGQRSATIRMRENRRVSVARGVEGEDPAASGERSLFREFAPCHESPCADERVATVGQRLCA